ncbi:DEAD/DEAH box helicase [Shewanella submarina]|uniref:DEAD/DEAH box helicase n=1 Tax=Shewanella submarina TaxID=2016376 RepID=A0ABV7GB53_9GAMM|nr:DEAD/DEAH box helicase [Shewanella submarina]MCL1038366.1 DEAD/DEAH box helicase [Shewanella submarina]
MELRSYQSRFVSRSIAALQSHSGVIGIAATGAGKTVMLSAVAKEFQRVLVLQHQTELLEQNSNTFAWVCPDRPFGLVDPNSNEHGHTATFAMRQTLINRLDDLQPVDLIVIDECHHTPCSEYAAIIERARQLNPGTKLFGVTATPERGDKANMSAFYDVISDKVNIDDLIRLGYLVPPTAYIIKLASSAELAAAANDDELIEGILNTDIANERVIEEWKDKANGRRTVVFCQTVAHAKSVAAAFDSAGISATYVDGRMPARTRKKRLKDFEKGKYDVVTNATLLTEGYDCQPISCVILLRASSSKSSLIQMVGRGLRQLDPSRFPDVVKFDCVVLDFGISLRKHGNLDAGARLSFDQDDYQAETDPALQCPACGGAIEYRMRACPTCHHIIERDSEGVPKPVEKQRNDFEMAELEIFKASRFHYERVGKNILITHGWQAWVLLYNINGVYYTVGAKHKCRAKLLGCTPNKIAALATADDFVSQYGDPNLSGKQKEWLRDEATLNQIQYLPERYHTVYLTKHQAMCLMVLAGDPGRWERIRTKCREHYEQTGHKYAVK